MAPPKSYLEYSSRFGPAEERFSGNVPSVQELRHTGLRRSHLRAYFSFMRPEIAHLLGEYGKKATSKVCSELYSVNARAVPTPYFELVVDRITWKLWFAPFYNEGPTWPWPELRCPSILAQGETPNRIYAQYILLKQAEDKHVALVNTKAEEAPSAVPDPNAEFIVVSKAHIINVGDPEPVDVDELMRQSIWDTSVKKSFAECNAVGPFEVEPRVSTEKFVGRDLAAINSLLPTGIAIKLNTTNKRVIVTVMNGKQGEHMQALQKPFLEIWEHVRYWDSMTKIQWETTTLLEHFQKVKAMGGLVWDLSTF
ncbi:hypothetical protein F53441_12322 [Fusarium austroafricanum]|uniref:Uncharacterized protein n=1 Tax=Fusarium austroafricanum TaxID=2364996 RepID=A0A8H4JZF9_9HYPO|nr:hypothetical protein F53441_12322 [Fusarium austroafricanum]